MGSGRTAGLLSAGILSIAASCAPSVAPEPQPAVVAKVPFQAPRVDPANGQAADCIIVEQELDRTVTLRLSPLGPVAAKLGEGPLARLELPATRASAAQLVLVKNGVTLWTPYDEEEAPVFLRRPVAVAGVVFPMPHSSVKWQSVSGRNVRVRYGLSHRFEPIELDGIATCDALGLNQREFDVADIRDRPCEPGERHVPVGEAIEVRESPGAADSVRIRLQPETDPHVAVWRVSNGWAEVCLPTLDEVIIGWVREDVLSQEPLESWGAGLGLSGLGGLGARGKSHYRWTRCPHRIALFARLGSDLKQVGEVAPNTRFETGETHDGLTAVDFWDPWIWPEEDVEFLMEKQSLEGCKSEGH